MNYDCRDKSDLWKEFVVNFQVAANNKNFPIWISPQERLIIWHIKNTTNEILFRGAEAKKKIPCLRRTKGHVNWTINLRKPSPNLNNVRFVIARGGQVPRPLGDNSSWGFFFGGEVCESPDSPNKNGETLTSLTNERSDRSGTQLEGYLPGLTQEEET